MNKQLKPQDLDARLAQLAEALTDAEREIDGLALPAAAGERAAIDKLAKAQAAVAAMKNDREILERARAAAATQIDEAALAEAEAARAAAKERAVGHASRLVDMALRVDALAEEFRSIVLTMPEVEAALWAELKKAGDQTTDGVIGRRNLASHAVSTVTHAHLPLRPRGCAEVARVAWSFLVDKDI